MKNTNPNPNPNNHIKKVIFSILFISALNGAFAQKADSLKVASDKQVVTLGKHTILSQTKIEDLLKWMGTPSRIEKAGGMDRYYVYDNLGLSFDAGKKGVVEAVYVNYNWDKDKKAAQESFKGVLLMDNYLVNATTKADDIKSKTHVKDIVCLGPTMCISNPTPANMAITIGYNETAKITQIVFGFTK